MSYKRLVDTIIDGIGGAENINSLEHCATRLRFKLKDLNLAKTETLEEDEGIISIMKSGGQYQIVIGNHVHDVYMEILDSYPRLSKSKDHIESKSSTEDGKILDIFIDTVTGVFTPVLGLLAATGVIKGILSLLTTLSVLDMSSSTYLVLYTIADGFFYSLPIFLGYTASKKFGGSPFIGMAIAISLIYPTIIQTIAVEPTSVMFAGSVFESNIYGSFLGIPLILTNYTSSVIPIIVSAYFAAKLEKQLQRFIPNVIKFFAIPAITLLIVVPLTFLAIGPVTTWASNLVGAGVKALYNASPVLSGIISASIWQVLVIFGLHWGPSALMIANLTQLGYDPIWGLIVSASFAQVGAIVAVYLKTKDSKMKSLCIPSAVSGLFGITEPGIYGVTLPLKKPFIASCIAAAIGGAITGFFGSVMHNFGGGGIFEVLNFIHPENGLDQGWWGMIIGCIVALVMGFILTIMIGFKDKEAKEKRVQESKANREIINTPVEGRQISLKEVDDNAFASGALGKGIAIIPTNGTIVAPVDGTIKMLFPTKHAIGLVTNQGIEILIHIGIDTVKLEGQYFEALVDTGDVVKKGQTLITVDLEAVKEAGYDIVTPMIITNSHTFPNIEVDKKEFAYSGDMVITVNH